MAGPLSGIAGQQQIPLATSLQSGQNTGQAREREDAQQSPEQDRTQVQPQGAAVAESQSTETGNQDVANQENAAFAQNSAANDPLSDPQPRGSQVDILV